MRMVRSWLVVSLFVAPLAWAQEKPEKPEGKGGEPKPDFPSFDEVSKDFEKVVSTADGASFYGLWQRKKDGQMLAELPQGFASQKHYFALTVPTGELFAGLELPEWDHYAYWKRFDKRLALIEPNLSTRSTGDQESKDSLENHFTDRVVVDVPIVCMGPNGQPVIDLDELLLGNIGAFYPGANVRKGLAAIAEAKAFPKNVEIAFEVPVNDSNPRDPRANGALKTFHFSISDIPQNPAYKPRKSDERVGFFTTSFRDLGKFRDDQVWTRYINRWHLEKADPSLKLSPPKQPIVFYLEHTVPVRYRRFVKDGVLAWNKAFEKIGISDAIVVQFQDKTTGANMEKDPEDVRYNFIRWLSNDIGTAIGPSRAHPETGEILDADVVLTDGWIRHFWYQSNEFLPATAMENMSAETLRWLDRNPDWDPRVRLADPAERDRLVAESARRALFGPMAYGSAFGDGTILSNPDVFQLAASLPHSAQLCMVSAGKAQSMALAGLVLDMLGALDVKPGGEPKGESIDGIPEWFLGPVLSELVSHEVGHTLGLRHNFRASSVYTLEQVNSPEMKGKKPLAGSVMDYLPINVVLNDKGELEGDVDMIGIGPYDMWAIEYGYTFDEPAKVLERVSDPELTYCTDEDTGGCDPLARRYDFAADPMAYAKSRMKLVELARGQILDKFVKAGDSWAKARRGYQITLNTQLDAVTIMSDWLGGSFVRRDHKGDPGDRKPVEPVSAEKQRLALDFVLQNTFYDKAFGFTPELLARMTVDKNGDDEGGQASQEAVFPVNDRVAGVQATIMTRIMNPTTLKRVYDNELAVGSDTDALTLPEMMDTVSKAVWEEIGFAGSGAKPREASFNKVRAFTVRTPAISSLRRNLQREHVQRLIDLSLDKGTSSSMRSIALLARMTLQKLEKSIDASLAEGLDPYTEAHLTDAKARISKALDASYTYNTPGPTTVVPSVRFGQGEDQPR